MERIRGKVNGEGKMDKISGKVSMKGLMQKGGLWVRSIRGGLVTLIPILMIGSFALIFKSLPVPVYQDFLKTPVGSVLERVFTVVYNVTYGGLSVYMAACIGYYTERNEKVNGETGYGAVFVSMFTFLVSVGFLSENFELVSLNASGMFLAILCSTLFSHLYLKLSGKLHGWKLFTDGSDPYFNRAVCAIIPMLIVVVAFVLISDLICYASGTDNLWRFTAHVFTSLFIYVGEDFWGGLLFVVLSTVMWFFGIHGSDMLESVNVSIFLPAAKANAAAAASGMPVVHVYTKTFFDVFVLMGGCGTLICLLLSLLLFSQRRSSRSLAGIAAFPMLFNINEIMVFGLPIICNPTFFIPFVGTPLAAYLIASAALNLGLVPLTTTAVEWTTPIIIGGYEATGSVAGVILQLVILGVGTAIYTPFVKKFDCEKAQEASASLDDLVDIYRAHEAMSRDVILTELEGVPGETAKRLVGDLKKAIVMDELFFLYQPQYNYSGRLFGAEALLRWNHPQLGMIYPPLIIKIAGEAGLLGTLEKYIYKRVGHEIEGMADAVISINVTAISLQDDRFIDFLIDRFPDAMAGKARICVEVTEQEALPSDQRMTDRLARLKENGFHLAIDDFSMGHTSLTYLQEGCFDEVKLDGALTRKILTDANVRDIISSILFLSDAMGVTVIAEYVETEAQKDALAGLGCFNYQGYLYSPPVPVAEFETLMKNQSDVQGDENAPEPQLQQ